MIRRLGDDLPVILMDRNQTVDLAPRFAKIGAKVYRRQVYPAPLTHVYFVSSNPKPTPKWSGGKGHAFSSLATVLIALLWLDSCRQADLDNLRKDVDRDTAQIHLDVREMRKEVQGNAKNIAVLNNQVKTIVKSLDKVDRKLDVLLDPSRRRPIVFPRKTSLSINLNARLILLRAPPTN